MKVLYIGLSCFTLCLVSYMPGREYSQEWGSSLVSFLCSELNDQSKNNNAREHRYIRKSAWEACGVIQYDGYDGWLSREGQRIECNDKAVIHWVKDEFGSERAANKELENRLQSMTKESRRWKIAQEFTVDDLKVIELSEAVGVNGDRIISHKWALMKVITRNLITIYGPDKDHVVDYYYYSMIERRKNR